MDASRPGLIKADALQNLTDARYFSAREVDYLGFNLDPQSGNALALADIQAIRPWLAGPKVFGELGKGQHLEFALQAQNLLQFDGLELPSSFPLAELSQLPQGLSLLMRLPFSGPADAGILAEYMEQRTALIEYFILDLAPKTLEDAASRAALRELLAAFPCLLRADWPSLAIMQSFAGFGPKGYCLRGGAEEKVGFKSFDDLDELMDWLSPEL